MNLSGRVALVTGGAGRIGRAVAEGLAEVGAALAIVDIDAAGAEEAARGLRERQGVAATAFGRDLGDLDGIESLVKAVVADLGGLDILVNCAALVGSSDVPGWAVPLEEQSVQSWQAALRVNLVAPFALTKAAAGPLSASGHGAVVNIGSIYGVVGPDPRLYESTGFFNPAAYSASKGGLIQLTRWFATVLAPSVRVNTVVAGGVWRGHGDPFLSRYAERTPLRRMATETDLKGAVVYLACDLSAYVTGQNLVVDGGWTAW